MKKFITQITILAAIIYISPTLAETEEECRRLNDTTTDALKYPEVLSGTQLPKSKMLIEKTELFRSKNSECKTKQYFETLRQKNR